MSTTAEMVLEELKRCFPAARPSSLTSLVDSTQGDEPAEIAKAFRDQLDWTTLDADWLDQHYVALSFLSNEALCFYIPAFIAADLAGRLNMANPVFALTHGFAHGVSDEPIHGRRSKTWGAYAKGRWAPLTRAQAHAIVSYLEWRAASGGLSLDRDAIMEALAAYWYARAGGA